MSHFDDLAEGSNVEMSHADVSFFEDVLLYLPRCVVRSGDLPALGVRHCGKIIESSFAFRGEQHSVDAINDLGFRITKHDFMSFVGDFIRNKIRQ